MKITTAIKTPLIYCRYLFKRYFVNKCHRNYYLSSNLFLQRVSQNNMTFFGYYNVSPENNEKKIVYCSQDDTTQVNLYIKDEHQDKIIGKTSSFNLQQGGMEQWGYTYTNNLYYNRFNKDSMSYQAVCHNIKTGNEQIYPLPIYSLSKQEDFYLSLNFERLAQMRPDYGYFCREVNELPDDSEDGIWRVDMESKKVRLIINLQQLKEINPDETMKGALHKVNHIDISPDGKRFMFLHRWVGPMGRYMRLITANSDGSGIYILNGDKMTSHSYWMDSNHIVSFCYTAKYSNAYVVFEDKTDNVKKLSDKLPTKDGHPSTFGDWMITDTYPDLARSSNLLLYNMRTDDMIELGKFYQPLRYNGTERIDLHPKWNMDGSRIYFESGHNGMRNLYYIDVSKFVKR